MASMSAKQNDKKNLREFSTNLDILMYSDQSIILDLSHFVEAPYQFRDPYTHQIMREPVQVVHSDGMKGSYFDKASLEQKLRQEGNVFDPLNQKIIEKELNMNLPIDREFQGRISEWKKNHPNYIN